MYILILTCIQDHSRITLSSQFTIQTPTMDMLLLTLDGLHGLAPSLVRYVVVANHALQQWLKLFVYRNVLSEDVNIWNRCLLPWWNFWQGVKIWNPIHCKDCQLLLCHVVLSVCIVVDSIYWGTYCSLITVFRQPWNGFPMLSVPVTLFLEWAMERYVYM